jgi:hypothetical protein
MMTKFCATFIFALMLGSAFSIKADEINYLINKPGYFKQDNFYELGYFLDNSMLTAGVFSGPETCRPKAAFLAQVLLYSNELSEITSSDDEGRQYEGRTDLGNTQPGDGVRFKPRGAYKIIGRNAYTKIGKGLGIDLVNHPEWAEQPKWAYTIIGFIWKQWSNNFLFKLGANTRGALRNLYYPDSRPQGQYDLIERKIAQFFAYYDRAAQFFKCTDTN